MYDDVVTRSIVGKIGLDRMIKYSISGTPATRRNVEYRTDSYGRIFSPPEIGKYSGKIAEICNRIINSTGIILVYSQYIDGGLVPIALALEEMGFRRAGKMNSLFKTPPTNEIDTITSEPRDVHKSSTTNKFHPSKYTMITGDKSLSPDNNSEIKLLTSDNNVNGEAVRVVLISQAGSEGLDLKFIRQVHILDPWYNMNRIEQIIGRAIRTCSHKLLPFSKRNVEIYLHGTILDDNREEAADLYIYRLAEQKAIRVGEVSRVLKQSATDCLLNTTQVEFTPEILKQVVTQQLSSGQTIDYQVGDKPFTAICDYMSSCQYTCKPYKNITAADVTLDTYSEDVILMNTEKIIRRIRDLFKETFFYSKSDLVKHINAIHNNPLVQINAALNQLINDHYEYIIDKYGRIGNLINIGELYLFQPLELTNKRISTYHRSTPIDYKPRHISFKVDGVEKLIQESPVPPSDETTSKAVKIPPKKMDTAKDAKKLWIRISREYEKSTIGQPLMRGEKDWYVFSATAITIMMENGGDEMDLRSFVMAHILESLLFHDTLLLLNNLQIHKHDNTLIVNVKEMAKAYYDTLIISAKKINGIMLYNNKTKEPTIIIQEKPPDFDFREWHYAEKEDEEDLKPELSKLVKDILPIQNKMGSYAGFMSIVKNQYYIFKVKHTSKLRHKGARCDQSGKKEATLLLQSILSVDDIDIDVTTFPQTLICILQEFYLRLYNSKRKNGKRWFLTPSEVFVAI